MTSAAVRLVLLLLVLPGALAACKQSADSFFDGRPSGLAMVHGRVIAGGPVDMLELLRIPARFPDARPLHVAYWQYSLISWWDVPEKRRWIIDQLSGLTPAEREALERWVRSRSEHLTAANVAVLDEIVATTAQAGR